MAQNISFSANWICREVPFVSVITPADGLIPVPEKTIWFGAAKLARLKTLKASARNCKVSPSLPCTSKGDPVVRATSRP